MVKKYKNMKLNNNKILVILALSLSVFGCSDFLEDPIQYTGEEEVISSGTRSRGIIDDIYTDYSFKYFEDFSVEYLTDNGVLNSGETELATGYWGPTSNPYNYVWKQSYNNIRQVYQYIELVHETGLPYYPAVGDATLNENILNRYYGEAFFLKAWAEWELLKTFGGLSTDGQMLGFPIVNGILEDEAYALLKRNTYDECVTQINADLDVAIEYLPLIYTGQGTVNPGLNAVEVGRASGLAAYALKAKVALMAASPAFNPANDKAKWELAAKYAQEVIVKNGGLKDLKAFNFSSENNTDDIWRLRNNRQDNSLEKRLYPPTLYGQGEVNPSQNLIDAFPDSKGYPITNAASVFDVTNPYASRDARFYKFVFYNGDQCLVSGTCSDYNPLEIYEGGKDTFGGFIPNEGTRTGYYLKKFLSKLDFDPSSVDATTTLPKVYVQLGLTEVYLSYAEAVNEAFGQPTVVPAGFNFSAKDVLAKVRKRAGLSSDPYLNSAAANSVDFSKLVKNERRIELCFTGERFHDLRRWKEIVNTESVKGVKVIKNADATFSYQNIVVEKRAFQAKNYYLPLPYAELLLNSNLKQNQGW